MSHPYLPVLIFFIVALMVPIASLTLARLWMLRFTPIKRGEVKNALYECGVEPLAERQTRGSLSYWVAMIFLLLLAEGLLWAWTKGLLSWRGPKNPRMSVYGD